MPTAPLIMRIAVVLGLVLAAAAAPAAQTLPDWGAPLESSPNPPVAEGPTSNLGPPGTPGTQPPTQVPLDGGLGLLAIAGAAYAARRLRQTS